MQYFVAYKLDKSKICFLVKTKPLQHDKNVNWSKLKTFVDNKVNVAKKFVTKWVENIVVKVEKCRFISIFCFSHVVFK